jgi:hypothetical protein
MPNAFSKCPCKQVFVALRFGIVDPAFAGYRPLRKAMSSSSGR